MFNTGRRNLLFVVTATLPMASGALAIYQRSKSPTPLGVVAFFSGLALLSITASWYSHIRPHRELASAVKALLDAIGGRVVDLGKMSGIAVRINYLGIYRPARWLFVRKFFRLRWGIGMTYEPDNNAEFPIRKGVCGEAVARRRARLINMELAQNRNSWNFAKKELDRFPQFTAIWSLPIFELDRSGGPTGRVLGTINLDTTCDEACAVLSSTPEFSQLLEELQDLVSKIASC